ncbi:MAG: FAD-binding oxidoreductase [Ginsengibacter sp.]
MEEYPDEQHIQKIEKVEPVTHNVKRFTISKPPSYKFVPGQATDITINKPEWIAERRPFTFTGMNDWPSLEFTIKIYSDHNGVTNELGKLKPGDEIILHDVWGAIHYKGEGTFIAGGAGITPYIAILRNLYKQGKIGNNRLIFSNRTSADIILKDEMEKMLGKNFINTLTDEKTEKYDNSKIDIAYLKENIKDLSQYFYICGPDPMIDAIKKDLLDMGVPEDKVVIEQF